MDYILFDVANRQRLHSRNVKQNVKIHTHEALAVHTLDQFVLTRWCGQILTAQVSESEEVRLYLRFSKVHRCRIAEEVTGSFKGHPAIRTISAITSKQPCREEKLSYKIIKQSFCVGFN